MVLRVLNNEQLNEIQQKEAETQAAIRTESQANNSVVSSLSAYIRKCWEEAKTGQDLRRAADPSEHEAKERRIRAGEACGHQGHEVLRRLHEDHRGQVPPRQRLDHRHPLSTRDEALGHRAYTPPRSPALDREPGPGPSPPGQAFRTPSRGRGGSRHPAGAPRPDPAGDALHPGSHPKGDLRRGQGRGREDERQDPRPACRGRVL